MRNKYKSHQLNDFQTKLQQNSNVTMHKCDDQTNIEIYFQRFNFK